MTFDTDAYNGYITTLFAPQDATLEDTLTETAREHIRSMNVSAAQGQLLYLLALTTGASRILEIGTLGGYSGIHLARALPEDGRLVTLELDPHHAEVAQRNFIRAGVAHKVAVQVGPATQSLERLSAEGEPPFDLVFIDADKGSYPNYLRLSLPLLQNGGLLLADNTLRSVLEGEDTGTTRHNAAVAEHPELISTIIPVLRARGIDGLTVSLKRSI